MIHGYTMLQSQVICCQVKCFYLERFEPWSDGSTQLLSACASWHPKADKRDQVWSRSFMTFFLTFGEYHALQPWQQSTVPCDWWQMQEMFPDVFPVLFILRKISEDAFQLDMGSMWWKDVNTVQPALDLPSPAVMIALAPNYRTVIVSAGLQGVVPAAWPKQFAFWAGNIEYCEVHSVFRWYECTYI